MEKLKVNVLKTEIYFIGTMLILFAIFYCTIGDIFNFVLPKNFIIIGVFSGVTLVFSILIPKTFKLEYDNSAFYVTRFGKTKGYRFADVLYIDDIYTKKHGALTFYTNKGKLEFIAQDKNKSLLEIFEKNCKKTISREAFHSRFPTISL